MGRAKYIARTYTGKNGFGLPSCISDTKQALMRCFEEVIRHKMLRLHLELQA